jgi:hypothetical protein
MELLDLHLGRPVHRGALTLFPIWNGHAVTARGYDLADDRLGVEERAGSAVVAELVVTNPGRRPALLLEGELLEGGLQHRVAARSVLIGAGASQILEVRCVEQGRWSGTGRHARSGRRAPLSVRAAEGQGATWERVRSFEQRYGASPTGSLLQATGSADARAARLVEGLRPLPYTCGLLICVTGQPVQLEAYDSPRTLAVVWDALLQAAAVDALDTPPVPTPGRRARRFLDRALAVPPVSGYDAGAGTGLQGASPLCRLRMLAWRGRAVHTVAINPRHPLVAV